MSNSSAGMPPLPPHLDPRVHQHRRAGDGHRKGWALISAKVLSALLSAAILASFAYGWKNYRDLNNGLQRLTIHTGLQKPTGGATPRKDIDGKDENLLIVGNDDRTDMTRAEANALHTGLGEGSISTDTMMIVHIPANGSKATLISLPRDSYVAIPGYGMNKLNSAYSDAYRSASGTLDAKRAAGADLLIKTVTNLTGLTIDHFLQVGLIGFYRISNAIGGVPINLCNAVDDTRYSGFKMSAGHHTIKGVTALEFVRQRHGLSSDIARTERQRYFLTAAFRKIASAGTLLNPSRLRSLTGAVDKSLYVDSGLNLQSLAVQMGNLSANNIVGKAIPYEGFNNNSPVGSVVVVDPVKVQKFVANLIQSGDSTVSSAKTVAPSSVTVSVLNGGAVNGAAARGASTLKTAGFVASAGDATTRTATTTIRYSSGMEAQAKTLAKYVPGAALQKTSVSTLTLVLGSDGLTAKSTATKAKTPSSTTKSAKAVDSGCIN